MSRKLVVVLICVSFFFSACDAFKDHYDPSSKVDEMLQSQNAAESEVPPASSEGATLDYSIDETPCTPVEGVEVVVSAAESEEMANSGWTEEITAAVKAVKIGEFTTMINIEGESVDKLLLKIKQVAADKYDLCEVILQGCEGECLYAPSMWPVEEGKIIINAFNKKGEGEEIVNAGTFELTFGTSDKGDEGKEISGSYKADSLSEDPADVWTLEEE